MQRHHFLLAFDRPQERRGKRFSLVTLLTFRRQNYFFNFSTPCIQNVNNTGTKYVTIMKQTAFWREKNGEYIPCLTFWRRNYFFNFSTPVYKMWIIQEPNVRIMKQTAFWREKNGEYIPYLTFWRRNYFFLILAHPVYKMWIIQEPNMLELWNKLHFEEEKTESTCHA
jgi:hypothetical protein